MCALVPPKPKPEIAARLGVPGRAGHGVGCVGTRRLHVSISNEAGVAVKRCCGGMSPCCRPSTAWITEATPAAQPVWPISDLFDVTYTGCVVENVSRRVR